MALVTEAWQLLEALVGVGGWRGEGERGPLFPAASICGYKVTVTHPPWGERGETACDNGGAR